jgi:hypothetical protein
MTPEQRARMEAAAKARAGQAKTPRVHQSCLTKESLVKAMNFGSDENSACQRTVIRSSSATQDLRLECAVAGMKSTGTIHVEAIDSEHVKGTSQMDAAGGRNNMNVKISFTAGAPPDAAGRCTTLGPDSLAGLFPASD